MTCSACGTEHGCLRAQLAEAKARAERAEAKVAEAIEKNAGMAKLVDEAHALVEQAMSASEQRKERAARLETERDEALSGEHGEVQRREIAERERDEARAECEGLRSELRKKACCKGCPDCMPIGWRAELDALTRERDEARADAAYVRKEWKARVDQVIAERQARERAERERDEARAATEEAAETARSWPGDFDSWGLANEIRALADKEGKGEGR